MIGQGVNRLFPVPGQALEESPSRWVCKSLENVVSYGLHHRIITEWLWMCQARTRYMLKIAPVLRFAKYLGLVV